MGYRLKFESNENMRPSLLLIWNDSKLYNEGLTPATCLPRRSSTERRRDT